MPNTLSLVTNQFKINFHSKYVIHTYTISVLPDCKESREKMKDLLQRIDKELRLTFLNFIFSGQNLYSTLCLDSEDIYFEKITLNNDIKN